MYSTGKQTQSLIMSEYMYGESVQM